MQWQKVSMVVTLTGILATGWRARAEEPPRDAGAVPAVDPSRPSSEPGDGGQAPPPETKAPPVEILPTTGALPGAAENMETTALPAGPAEPAAAPGDEGGKGKKRKAGKGAKAGKDKDKDRDDTGEERGRFGHFELKGRVYARAEYDRRDVVVLDDMLQPVARTVDSLDLSVPTARVSLHYHAPMEWLTAVAEIDISGKPDMKDGYVQAKDTHFVVRAGQFKVPVAAIESTSPWTLPLVRRGLLHDVLTDRMDYGGRRPGVIVGYRDRTIGLHPRLTLGAFQGSYMSDDPTPLERETDLLNAMKFRSQSLVARAEVELAGADVGVYYEDRIGSPVFLQTYRYWTAGADAYYDRVFDNGGLRVWIDGMAGTSWYEHASKRPDGKDAIFVAARALVAYRFGGTADEAFYVEPYALGAALDPDAQVTTDILWEGVLGVNVGYWKRARLSLQGEINKGQRNFPAGYFVGPPPDRLGVILQAGVAF
ncbi:MAG TPA: hypothetical protein VK540_05630 [Polyangiaceae bacterium]|nr:hypothetical protein [Polyangiaceae bacterium]